uniref:Beta adaptin n=1 Tax=Trepomonas sp. PC1 TaxID=1076344 RepID=A0A146KIE8_9EUKA|eukprot:JAP96227.1 Beta adaptin [Trepomonas sp. PC1]
MNEEIKEWRDGLANARSTTMQKEIITSVIKAMSSGRDVSPLFPDVLKLMQTKDLKLKKLIYVFLTSNAMVKKEQALLCVNALEMDANDTESPVIRATAVRTMGSVATKDTCEYYVGALAKAIKDTDPFVRKCAATCIAKLFKVNREPVIDSNLVVVLKNLLSDGNQAVVASAAGAIISIVNSLPQNEVVQILNCESDSVVFNQQEVSQLLTVLSQATEWAALSILQAISKYGAIPVVEEAPISVQRLQPFLRHQNPTVSLNAINVMIRYCKANILPEDDIVKIQQDCVSAVISLISQNTAPAIQWITLRSLRLIAKAFIGNNPFEQIQKHFRLLFVRFNDELYVKLEKIEALALFCSKETANDVVKELKDYCEDVAPEFVRASIAAIGLIACRIPEAADQCVKTYMDMLNGEEATEGQAKSNFRLPSYAAQELMVSIQNIFRTYPDRYEGVIGSLCEAIQSYDNPNAKASLIWILGEYSTRIEGVEEIIIDLLNIDMESQTIGSFLEDPVVIQQAVVTAAAKIYLANPNETTQMLFNMIISKASTQCLSPDVRMRANYFMRLIQMDTSLQLARSVVFVQKPAPVYGDGLSLKLSEQLSSQLGSVPATLREIVFQKKQSDEQDTDELVKQFGGFEYEQIVTEIAAVEPQQVAQPQVQFVPAGQGQQQVVQQEVDKEDIFADFLGPTKPIQAPAPVNFQPTFEAAGPALTKPGQMNVIHNQISNQPPKQADIFDDMFDDQPKHTNTSTATNPSSNAPQISQVSNSYNQTNPFDPNFVFATSAECPIRMKDPNQSIKVKVSFTRLNNQPTMLILVKNDAQFPFQNAQIAFAPNVFGLTPVNKILPMIPAMGMMNQGQWYSVQCRISQELCGFPAQKLGQMDPQLQATLNLLNFTIGMPNQQPMQYQTKIPVNSVWSEASQYHSQDRQLIDAYQAINMFKQMWPNYVEFQSQVQVQFAKLGVNNMKEAITQVTQQLFKNNLNHIETRDSYSTYIISQQINVSQCRNMNGLVQVNYTALQGAIGLTIQVRVPGDLAVTASYIASAIQNAFQ